MLEAAYNSLTPARQALLGRIACFRSPVKYEALKALAASEGRVTGGPDLTSDGGDQGLAELAPPKKAKELDADLRDLVARGLLHHDTNEGRFDLHPIVRRYAYDRLAEEALLITERSGYVLQGADAHLELAKLAPNLPSVGPSCGSAQESGTRSSASLPVTLSDAIKRASPAQRAVALHHATKARRLATCDGPPDYTYKAAYDEAEAFLRSVRKARSM